MRDLLADYRKETIEELLKIYLKSSILKEFLFVFPFLTKISFTDNDFSYFISKKLRIKYYEPVSSYIETEDKFLQLCAQALLEIQNALSTISNYGPFSVLDIVKDFPNLAFKLYETEKDVYNTYTEDDRYSKNNLYSEVYVRVEDNSLEEARNDEEKAFLLRPNEFRGIVNPTSFKELLDSSGLTQDRFLALIRNRYLGVRIVYNSQLHLANVQNHKTLYDSILEDSKYIFEKTNALAFKHNPHTTLYKFPLVLAKKEVIFPAYLGSIQAMKDYINSTQYYQDIFFLKTKLWEDANFAKMFIYHIPVKAFQSVLFNNFCEKYYLLQEVMQENKVFQDLDKTIIKLLQRIKFAEDPTNI